MSKKTYWPSQCSKCGGKIKKKTKAYQALQVNSTGELVKWFRGSCSDCGQAQSVRASEKMQKTEQIAGK